MSAVAAWSVLFLFLMIGTCQTLWLKSPACSWLKLPIDGGLHLFGSRVFGDHKTIRGFVLIIPVSTLIFGIFGHLLSPAWKEWQLTPSVWAWAGFLIGWGYMLGELPNSFLKRQLSIGEGQKAANRWQRIFFNVLDESDSIIGALIFGSILLPIDALFVAVILPSGTALHWTFNQLFLQRRPMPLIHSAWLYYVSFALLTLSLILVWPIAWIHPRINHELIQKYTRLGLWFLGIRYEVKGRMASDTGILLCNHSSWLDQLLLIAIAPKPLLFVANEKYFRLPFLAWVLRCQGSLRKPNSLRTARWVQNEIKRTVDGGRLVVIFPEGTRSELGFPLPWRGNLRRLPQHIKWESAWISGASNCLPRASRLRDIKPGLLQFRLMEGAANPGQALRDRWIEHWILDHLVPLSQAHDPQIYGGKAAQLARSGVCHQVPPGFVLAAAVAERMNDPREGSFPERLDCAIDQWFQSQVATKTWVVRSSAIGEDGEDHSFAGQLDSILHVKSSDDFKKAIRQVFASQKRAAAYEVLTAQKLQGCAVILQEQVAAMFAGVAFSRFVQGQAADFLIEYTEGLGEDLVQGRVIPSRVHLCRRTGQTKDEIHQGNVLPDDVLKKIFQMGMALEKSWGCSVDLEWAVDHAGELFLLQVRAVTRDGRLAKLLSNANMNENYPKPVTPFLFSFAAKGYQHYFLQLGEWTGVPKRILKAAEPALRNILGVHQGHLYYNLTAVRECLGQLPFSNGLIRFWDEFLGIGVVDLPTRAKESRSCLFLLRFLLRFAFFLSVFPWLSARFQRRVQQTLTSHLPGDPLSARHQQLKDICRVRFTGWGEAALCDAAVMVYTGFLRALLARSVAPDAVPRWSSRLLSGSAAISAQQLDDLRDLQTACLGFPDLDKLLKNGEWSKAWEHITRSSHYTRIRLHVNQWLERWGTRVSGELMLTEPNYLDDPLMLLKLLGNPIAQADRTKPIAPYRALLRESFQSGGWRTLVPACLALAAAGPARAAVRARERCRLAQSHLYGALRANLLGTGRILQARGLISRADDLFFLSLDELLEFLHEGSYSLSLTRQTIDLRRQKYLAYQDCKVAERIGRRAGHRWFSWEDVSSPLPANMHRQGAWQQRFGLPASSGFVKGRIRILRSTEECHKLKSGEILVTRETDPGWIVAMGRAAALVVERGGMLSHGAIVARELGIPAVVGLRDITEDLQDGMEIEVDGLKGMIRWTNSESFVAGGASASLSGTMGRLR